MTNTKPQYIHRHSEEYIKGYVKGKQQGKLDQTKELMEKAQKELDESKYQYQRGKLAGIYLWLEERLKSQLELGSSAVGSQDKKLSKSDEGAKE